MIPEDRHPIFEKTIKPKSSDETHEIGVFLGQALRAGDLVVLNGDLGAGKTTLTRGIGEGLNVRGPITSPTFVLARTHPSLNDGPNLVHVDAYRLSSADEFDDLDIDYETSAVVVEWGSGMVQESDSHLEINIVRARGDNIIDFESEEEPREMTLRGFGKRWSGGIEL